MIYKEQITNLLDALSGKLRIIENVANGSMRLTEQQVNVTIGDAKKIVERISEIISIER